MVGSVTSQLLVNDVPALANSKFHLSAAVNCGSQYFSTPTCMLSVSILNSSGDQMPGSAQDSTFVSGSWNYNWTVDYTIPTADTYTVVLTFTQFNHDKDPSNIFEARVYTVSFSQVDNSNKISGASSCQECALGQMYSSSGCVNCPAGKQSTTPTVTDQCQTCPTGTFSAAPGSTCLPCGQGTTPFVNRTGCDIHGCVFSGPSGYSYNFMPLSRPNGDMYIAGQTPQPWGAPFVYYINPCTTLHPSSACYDANTNQSLPYMVCQTTQDGVYDLGSVLGFTENAIGNTTLTFSGGMKCPNGNYRVTTVQMICDMNGIGQPQRPANQTHVEIETCVYNLEWSTRYACPQCHASDYVPVYGVCHQNVQRLFYVTDMDCVDYNRPPDTFVQCSAPSPTDRPQSGSVFVNAVLQMSNTTNADLLPSALSRAFSEYAHITLPVQAILDMYTGTDDASSVQVRVTVQNTSLAALIAANISAVVNKASLGSVVSDPWIVYPETSPGSDSSSGMSAGAVGGIIFIVLLAVGASVVAIVFYWKNRKLRYQNYRLVKEAGQDNGISNELYDDSDEKPTVLRPSGTGMRFLNQPSVNALYADDDDDALS